MADRAVLETAVDAIASEAKCGVSIRSQMPFEKVLEDAARAGHRFIRQQARSGGKALKRDPLQGTIIDIVRQNPVISSGGLLKELRLLQVAASEVRSINNTRWITKITIHPDPDAASALMINLSVRSAGTRCT